MTSPRGTNLALLKKMFEGFEESDLPVPKTPSTTSTPRLTPAGSFGSRGATSSSASNLRPKRKSMDIAYAQNAYNPYAKYYFKYSFRK
ncbi:Protein CBG26264 [Caenorhabditis briggsae]|uniref:Uncharacterized protein n=2 Tax=Caenorhabditis briggsae TaxID=6238 RepID=A0AAE9D302_CAEBR|nr:Protein CBG26264 [Caenorhabditis briggsae]ULT93609.1 hypothetical protein L3Y34_003242 [Caenorhabditis briggsae]UMM26862.1 hypothetical protein L5515_010395 [Caenorhabditis briggsae]CAS00570.1 Protein CBG26264 [Caenorhabditis briggsae]